MLKIRGLSKSFNKNTDNQIDIFDNFDLTIQEGTSTAIIGSNGSGKSTLLNLISGSLQADGGSILIDDVDISKFPETKRSTMISKVYQDPSKSVSPSLTILENMALADNKGEKFGLSFLVNKDKIDNYKNLLSSLNLGLENMLNSKASLLSGGQRQSLSLIMASMKNPKLLLLDEHTAALDPKTSRIVLEKTRELIHKKNITTLMITHNMRDAIKYADRVIMLKEGVIALDELTKNITENDLNKLYSIEWE